MADAARSSGITASPAGAATGGIFGAVGIYAEGSLAEEVGKYNALVARQNAALIRQQTVTEETRYRQSARKELGAMRAAYGASGVTMAGSPTAVLLESAKNAELNALNIRRGGRLQALALESEAELAEFYGKQKKRTATLAAAGQLLGTAATVAKMG